jgi:N-carbamoylputrescine amidase
MKVTVCELGNDPEIFARDWERLVYHVKSEHSDLVLLPEMPFFPWFAWLPDYDPAIWQAAVRFHDSAEPLLKKLAPAIICGTRPANKRGKRFNQAFIWKASAGFQSIHAKYYLPNEDGFWEATWYNRGPKDFTPVQVDKSLLGFLICTEIWFFEHSRTYGKKGVHIIACPRATPTSTLDKWLVAGRSAAVVSGAFCLSSNRISQNSADADLGGQGWIVEPDGRILGLTTPEHPFLTLDIDLSKAEKAKYTYPRYVPD